MASEYDVLIVGAGPAGCTAAQGLASAGWSVGVLEEHPQVGDPVNCSGVVSVEAFRRYCLPEDLIRHTLRAVRFQSPGKQWWTFDGGRPLAHAVDRTKLDQLLAQRAAKAGARVLLGHSVVGVRPASGAMVIDARTREGEPIVLKGRAVILATGAGVPLLRAVGWGSYPDHLLGVQTEIGLATDTVEVYLGKEWAPEGFAWIIPLGGGRAKAGLMCRQDGPQHLHRFVERADVGSRIQGEPGRVLCSVLPLGFLSRSYGDRILVVGEAAGQIKATTCGGIYYGMLTAGLAAEVLDSALKADRLDAGSLAVYERRWRHLLEEEIEIGLKLRRVFHLLNDYSLDALVALASRDGILRLIQENMDFDWHRDLIRAVFRHAAVSRILGSS